MVVEDNRPSVRLGDIEFDFEHPILEKTTTGRKAEHELLPTEEDGTDGRTVIQPLGNGKTTMTLSGTAYRREVSTGLDDIEGTVVSLRHPRHSGEVFVSGVNTAPFEGIDDEGRWYEFSVDLIATGQGDLVQPNVP
jgi:hypothetical protein